MQRRKKSLSDIHLSDQDLARLANTLSTVGSITAESIRMFRESLSLASPLPRDDLTKLGIMYEHKEIIENNKQRKDDIMTIKIQCGNIVRDTITGFEGKVIAITEWLNGCRRIGVQSQTLHEGKPINPEWFDEMQLEIIEGEPIHSDETKGGPRNDPKHSRSGE